VTIPPRYRRIDLQWHDGAAGLTERRTPTDRSGMKLWRQNIEDDHDHDRVHGTEENTNNGVEHGVGDEVVDQPDCDFESDTQDGAESQLVSDCRYLIYVTH